MHSPKCQSPSVNILLSLDRISEALVTRAERVRRGAVENVRNSVDREAVQFVQHVMLFAIRQNLDESLRMSISDGVVRGPYLRDLVRGQCRCRCAKVVLCLTWGRRCWRFFCHVAPSAGVRVSVLMSLEHDQTVTEHTRQY